jgi:predicted nucleic acid-binding protein
VIFVDSNIPMYLVGAEHPHKADAQRILERCISEQARLVTDAEVLQEILHLRAGLERPFLPQPTPAERSPDASDDGESRSQSDFELLRAKSFLRLLSVYPGAGLFWFLVVCALAISLQSCRSPGGRTRGLTTSGTSTGKAALT